MSILPAQTIEHLCVNNLMVQPFKKKTLHSSGLTGGLSESGYDFHIDQDIVLYPKSLKYMFYESCGLNFPSFCLASTIENLNIPSDVMVFVLDKSTWARRGLTLQTTCIEPGFKGYITLELNNQSSEILTIERGQPIGQFVFHYLHAPTYMPYCGKYNNAGPWPQPAILEKDEQWPK